MNLGRGIIIAVLSASLISGCAQIMRHRATSGVRHSTGAWKIYDRWPFDSNTAAMRQDQTASDLGLEKNISLDVGGGKSIAMTLIPAGEFSFGSDQEETGREYREGPQQTVVISRPFYMSIHEITQDQYKAVTGENPSHFVGGNLPVEFVTWDEANSFCKKLSEKTEKRVALPTEAQWEYACRAGTQSAFCFGKTIATHQANYDGNYVYGKGGKRGLFRNTTTVGGEFPPNAFGLYDMHGNVWEWCGDWFEDSYLRIKNTDPQGAPQGTERVLRGGCWYLNPSFARSAYRSSKPPDYADERTGFRIVMDISAAQSGGKATSQAAAATTATDVDETQAQRSTSGPVFDRLTSAREIRGAIMEIRAKHPNGGEAMWRQLAAMIRPGMTMRQAKLILPPDLDVNAGAIKRGGGKYSESWPVDAKTIVELGSSDGDDLDSMIVESMATVRAITQADFRMQADAPQPSTDKDAASKPSPTSAPANWELSPGGANS